MTESGAVLLAQRPRHIQLGYGVSKMKKFKQFSRYLTPAALAAAAGSAVAAVPADVSGAIETAGTDGATVAGLVLVAVVGIFAFTLMRKGLR